MTTEQLRVPLPRAVGRIELPSGVGTTLVAIAGAAALAWIAVSKPEWHRTALAAVLALNLLVVAARWPRAAAVALLMLLPFVALLRRLLIEGSGWVENDPLLLVGPIVATFLVLRLFLFERRPIVSDTLSKLVLALGGVALLQAFNPLGVGGVAAGLAGLIFLGVPLLFFFLGRELGDRLTMSFLVGAVVVTGVIVAVYGTWQTKFGSLLPWDLDWYEVAGYAALRVGGLDELRPWSTFSSSSEYAAYLSVALVFAWAALLHGRLRLMLAAPVLLFAGFFAGGRSVLVLLLLSGLIMLAARRRSKVVGLLVVVVGIGATYGLAVSLGPAIDRAAGIGGDAVAKRNVGGILNPLDPTQSTLLVHGEALGNGVAEGFTNPAGSGAGATNLAAERVGDAVTIETDNDLADVFVSFGAIGGLLFFAIIVLAFRQVFSRYSRERDWLVLAVAGFMVVTLGFWLNGGHYAVAPLVWFAIGWASRRPAEAEETVEEEAPPRRLARRLRRYAGGQNGAAQGSLWSA